MYEPHKKVMTSLLAMMCRLFMNCGCLYFTRFPLCYQYDINISQSKSLYSKEINPIVTVIVIYSVRSSSHVVFSSITSCNSIRMRRHQPSIILKTRPAALGSAIVFSSITSCNSIRMRRHHPSLILKTRPAALTEGI